MVGEWLGDPEDDGLSGGVGDVGIGRGDRVRGDDRVALEVRVIDEEAWVGRVVGMEGEPEQAPFTAAGDPVPDIEERPLEARSVTDGPDGPGLFGHEQAPAPVARVGDLDRGAETRHNDIDLDLPSGGIERRAGIG